MGNDLLENNIVVVGGARYGTHAARPVASTVPDGTVYCETDTNSVFQVQVGVWALIDSLTTAAVVSVFSRTGTVTAQSGDYTVDQVTNAAPRLASGTVNLVGGTVDVTNASITANSVVLVNNVKSAGTVGALSVVLTAGVKFTINSTSGTDTSKIYWQVVSF